MKIKDLGPFAVFKLNGRVYVKSSGMIQMLDRSGTHFETNRTTVIDMEADVEPVDLKAVRDGQDCQICFGSGYEPGKWHDSAHGYGKKRCPAGCLVEGLPDPVEEKPKEASKCECCNQPLLDCEKGAPPGIKEKAESLVG